MSGKLTIKQKKFADEYIISGNATEAYKLAGYAWTSDNMAAVEASKLLRNPKVKAYIEKRLKEIESEKIVGQTEVLKILSEHAKRESIEHNVTKDGDVVKTPTSVANSIKAAELIGKRYGLWTDKVDVTADIGVTIIDNLEGDNG